MLLAIDIGNTHIDLGLFGDEKLLSHEKYPTGPPGDLPNLPTLLASPPPRGAVVGSVVAGLGDAYTEMCRKFLHGPVLQVRGSSDWGLQIDYDNPDKVGVDRLAAAAAAHSLSAERQAVIVVDAGTALTVDAVDAKGTFLGGSIAPGLSMGIQALSDGTSLLSATELSITAPLLGKNTAAGLSSGALYGTAALVEGLCMRITEKLATPTSIFLTGGDSSLLHPHIARIDIWDPDLVLRGLALAYKRYAS